MKNRKYAHLIRMLIPVLAAFMFAGVQGQTVNNENDLRNELKHSKEKTAGIYYAYPGPANEAVKTVPPHGYEPFYVSHYGRHGSRYLTEDARYEFLLNMFESMNRDSQLTPFGCNVFKRLQKVWAYAEGRGGSLTSIGVRQHREIAGRMAERCPQIFLNGTVTIKATSSTVPRCILSMAAFCERLKEQNPLLSIMREASGRTMNVIAWNPPEVKALSADTSAWRTAWNEDRKSNIRPERLIKSLFHKTLPPDTALHFMEEMYALASDMQNVEMPEKTSFYDLFTDAELYYLWRNANWRMYICNAAAPAGHGIGPRIAAGLLKNFITEADSALAKDRPSATLRFGHDTNLIRLLALMQVEGCCNSESDPKRFALAWRSYHVSPMAANLQLTFYRNSAGNVMVALMLNENYVRLPLKNSNVPFYPWNEVRQFWSSLIK